MRNENLRYAYCDDWFIYAQDEKGYLYYFNTEVWNKRLELSEDKQKESKYVEKYVLPIALKNWSDLSFHKTDIRLKILKVKEAYQDHESHRFINGSRNTYWFDTEEERDLNKDFLCRTGGYPCTWTADSGWFALQIRQ